MAKSKDSTETTHIPLSDQIAYSPKSAAKVANVGTSKIYDWLNSGKLKAKKHGIRTIITGDALKECIDSFPDYEPSNKQAA
jgi:hypothetical protein